MPLADARVAGGQVMPDGARLVGPAVVQPRLGIAQDVDPDTAGVAGSGRLRVECAGHGSFPSLAVFDGTCTAHTRGCVSPRVCPLRLPAGYGLIVVVGDELGAVCPVLTRAAAAYGAGFAQGEPCTVAAAHHSLPRRGMTSTVMRSSHARVSCGRHARATRFIVPTG